MLKLILLDRCKVAIRARLCLRPVIAFLALRFARMFGLMRKISSPIPLSLVVISYGSLILDRVYSCEVGSFSPDISPTRGKFFSIGIYVGSF